MTSVCTAMFIYWTIDSPNVITITFHALERSEALCTFCIIPYYFNVERWDGTSRFYVSLLNYLLVQCLYFSDIQRNVLSFIYWGSMVILKPHRLFTDSRRCTSLSFSSCYTPAQDPKKACRPLYILSCEIIPCPQIFSLVSWCSSTCFGFHNGSCVVLYSLYINRFSTNHSRT